MAQIRLTVLICGLLAGSTFGANLFTETFPTGVSSGTWEVMPGNIYYTIPTGDNAHVMGGAGDQSAKQVDADPYIYYMRSKSGAMTGSAIPAGQKEVLTVYMWDDDAFHNGHPTNQPVSAGVMLASYTAGASDFFQISVNSGAAGGYSTYNWRTQSQGTFSTGVARSAGWHKFQIEVLPYTGSGDVKFYIDDVLAGTGNRNSVSSGAAFDQVRLGLSVKTYAPFWYDNVDVSMVPEPASIALLLLGGCALLRRRA
jgi:hypothetical protein